MKNILVIGASGGIGRVVAAHFLSEGYRVIGTNYGNEFSEELSGDPNFRGYKLDLASQEDIDDFAKNVNDLSAIVNCAGVVDFEAYNDVEKNQKIWASTMAVNLTGSYLLFEKLRDKVVDSGSYVLFSSTDAYFGGKVNTAYAASKAGVNSLTKSLALMYQDSKIRVNAIAPGWVETAMMEAGGDELTKYASDINPLKRNGSPQDCANLVDFLISEKASYINGQIITLDGGYTLQDPTLVFEEQQLSNK